MKRIVLCFDGTWNKPDEPNAKAETRKATNVCLFYERVEPSDDRGVRQQAWYNSGVGAQSWDKVLGGAFGTGLDLHIINGYAKLMELYDPGDEIFILGFSRGAYTARSLVGLLNVCGLARRPEVKGGLAEKAALAALNFMIDSTGLRQYADAVPGLFDNPRIFMRAREAYDKYRHRDAFGAGDFRAQFAQDVRVKFLGVWDTVGALGIPGHLTAQFNDQVHGFHDTKLSPIVGRACHAVAIDEYRDIFKPTLWEPDQDPGERLEQVWFAGAHSNVGGGYPDQQLSGISLRWMQDEATKAGLKVRPLQLTPENYTGPIADSYTDFWNQFITPKASALPGWLTSATWYQTLAAAAVGGQAAAMSVIERQHPRYYRPILKVPFGKESLDPSVQTRRDNPQLAYAPVNLGP